MKLSRQSFITAALLVSSLGFGGCSPAFWGGAAAGVLGSGADEVQSKRQMDQLDDDLSSGRIERREYEQRKSRSNEVRLFIRDKL